MKRIYFIYSLFFFIFFVGISIGQELGTEISISPTDNNLFYGNENVALNRLYWIDGEQIVGFRYQEGRPKDIVLLNSSRLIIDSLSINELFLEDFKFETGRFISLVGLIQTGNNIYSILHGFGTTSFSVNDGKFKIVEKSLPKKKPGVSKEYLSGYDLIQIENFTVGFKMNNKKWLKSADFWVYNWNDSTFAEYKDSQFDEVTNNTYWDIKKSPETFSTVTQFVYNISKTRDGLLFNLPLKNRFVIYDSSKSKMQGYQFPDLSKRNQARFVFYDWNWDRYFSVLDTGREYSIYSLDRDLKNYHLIATSKNQPIEFNDGKVYFREIIIKKGREEYYVDHYLGDLYPEIR